MAVSYGHRSEQTIMNNEEEVKDKKEKHLSLSQAVELAFQVPEEELSADVLLANYILWHIQIVTTHVQVIAVGKDVIVSAESSTTRCLKQSTKR